MPTDHRAVPVLGTRALNRALLVRQLLAERAALSAEQALAHLVGLQTQAPGPPYTGLWTRLEGFRPEHLSALLRDRRAVRVALMRSTLHLVTADDCLTLRPLLAESLARTVASAFKGRTAGADPAELAAAGAAACAEQPLTFAELGAALARRWPAAEPNALAQTVRNLVPLVQIPPRGLWGENGPALHVPAEQWLGRPLAPAPDPEALVLRYLAAFGPATVKDAQKWSGLSRLQAVFTRLGPRLRRYQDERGAVLYDLADTELPDPARELPVRLLPAFDNILLAHDDRARVLPEAHRPRVFTANGIIRPTVLVDGFVRAVWRLDRSPDAATATLTVTPLTPLTRAESAAVTEEAARLVAWTAPDATPDIRL